MADQNELGRFLKSRRSRLTPDQAGIDVLTRRRVSGLRREEVAALAGISVEYYVRLEQGRASKPSDAVLDALARALFLDEVERRYLDDLARPRAGAPRGSRADRPRAELVQLLSMLDRVPALVLNHRMDVLAWNRLSPQLFFDFAAAAPRDRNLARFAFLDEASKERFLDWNDVARATVGQLRLAAGRHADDDALATLLGELTMKSPVFRTLWAGRDVKQRTHGVKRFHHPLIGELPLRFENFDVCGESGQRLVTFSPEPGSPAQSALELLAMWTAPAAVREEAAEVPREV
ncbi:MULTISPECIES: helix-turn-helix transcriptional regulator [Actinokineospora]|uniref:Transcriptional regulator n=1 Tax=Actinokineospora fastidiosa TaxID=1816 RepID=A0A918LEY0_9PSEU|nr:MULTISPECIES: helix-turn-helix transcriptional regulator [Actinokineospora]UVS80801.1 Helix-turn-helix domain protein [Actinokineospora sp. UTMC 2448]GGS37276.1 transcriptional regulator [Actinokineospora fastidiosa]